MDICGVCSGAIRVDLDEDQAVLLVSTINEIRNLTKQLRILLHQHDNIPQMKKQIKKRIVGRVLKNTDEGQLLLKTLDGIRKSKLLPMPKSE